MPRIINADIRHIHNITGDYIREVERESIRDFMTLHCGYLRGRVLDYGAGKQPYKDLVKGEYVPYDSDPTYGCAEYCDGAFDAIMCNQAIQYAECAADLHYYWVHKFSGHLNPGGHLIMTYPLCWPEVERADHFRFTKSGMETLLTTYFTILHHDLRASIVFPGFSLPLGYGVVAQKV
jgi:hypothetical protein